MTLEFEDQNSNVVNLHERFSPSNVQSQPKPPFLVSLLIKSHIVKDERSAKILLLIIASIVFIISIYFIVKSFSGPVFIDKIKR